MPSPRHSALAVLLVLGLQGCRGVLSQPLDGASQALADQIKVAAQRGDLPEVRKLMQGATGPSASPDLRLRAGDALFMLGEYEAALREHEAAAQTSSLRSEATFEAVIDLMALRRFDEACRRFEEVPSTLLWGSAPLQVLRAHLRLRCGRPAEGLAELRELQKDGHSAAEAGLALVFGQRNVFRKYELVLSKRLKQDPADVGTRRALAELYICGEFANPFQPARTFPSAIQTLEETAERHPEDCAVGGRLATARLMEMIETAGQDEPESADLDEVGDALERFLEPQPGCAEAVEAQFLRLRHSPGDTSDERIRLLEAGVERFAERADLAYLLVQEHDVRRDHAVEKSGLEALVARSPDDWFPYVRLAFQTMTENGAGAESLAWISRGLAHSPDSLPLNYLAAVYLLREGRAAEAVEPAARLLAGLLETSIYHHEWDRAMAMLQNALDGVTPRFTRFPTQETAAAQFQSAADISAFGGGMLTSHGCFAPGSGPVGIVPVWYRPERVRAGLAAAYAEAPE